MSRLLTDEEVARQLGDLPGWTREGDAIVATIEAPDFPAAIRLVDEAADEAEEMNHHPDIDIRWRTTSWLLTTHAAGGLTQLDIELAHRISGRRPRGRRHARWLSATPVAPHRRPGARRDPRRVLGGPAQLAARRRPRRQRRHRVDGRPRHRRRRGLDRRADRSLTAGVAGLAAGAMSMAVGEYVSVSTQRDTEKALLAKEVRELRRGARGRARRAGRDLRGQGPDARPGAPRWPSS